MTHTPPTIGAALRFENLPEYRDWLISGQRDLEIQDPAWFDVLDGDWRSMVKEAKSVLDGYTGRMGVHGPFLGLPMLAPDPQIRAVVQKRLLQSLEICAELGATHMVVHSPMQFLGVPVATEMDVQSEEISLYGRFIHELMGEVVAFAASIQCVLVIENIFDTDPRLLLGLVKSFESDYVRMSIDTGHAFVNHTWGAAPALDYWVKMAGPWLGHVHLQDTDGHADRHWILGEGSIRWHAFFRALRSLEHKPRLILELADKKGIHKSMQYLIENQLGA